MKEQLNKLVEKLKVFVNGHRKQIQPLALAFINVFLIYYMLEVGNKNLWMNGPFFTILNIITVFVPVAAIYLFTQRWWISTLTVAVPMAVLSVINSYVIMFRNSPVSTQDIFNLRTAMSVMNSYSFALNIYIVAVIMIFAAIIFGVVLLFRMEKGKKYVWKNIIIKDICMILAFSAFIYITYLSPKPLKPTATFMWSWEESYHTYGYAATSIEVFQTSLNMVMEPDNYSEEALKEEVTAKIKPVKRQNKPDIIFILNETFYDMRDLVDLGDTPSPMPFIDSLPENRKGRVVVAGTGGGTNKSEYELLTSNSMSLMPGITPFNYLDFGDANSIVRHLESQGYTTWGGHCAPGLNYSRKKVYPLMGFDEIMFDQEFGKKELYEKRYYATDEFCYNRMLESYEKMGDAPRFMYQLTIQNHGNWDLNPDDADIIKVDADFGEYTDDVNEFMSCVSLSDAAFKKLTEYFEGCDRDVIICMVGDHGPSIATNLVPENSIEKTLVLRSTPYVIWSNFDLNENVELPSMVSMPFVTSMVLDVANCPTSPFYNYMSALRADVPVISAFGLYKLANGDGYYYTDETPYSKAIDIYFNLVYNNTSPKATRDQSLFDAYK